MILIPTDGLIYKESYLTETYTSFHRFFIFEPLWNGVSERGSSLLSFRHYHTLAFVVASGQVSHMDAKFLRNL